MHSYSSSAIKVSKPEAQKKKKNTEASKLAMEEERKWEELGVDCLANIFSKLDLEDLTMNVPLVCKPWLEASTDRQCWEVLNLRDVDLMPWGGFARRLERAYGIKRLSFPRFASTLLDRGGGRTVVLAFPAEHLASLQDLVYASLKCPRLKALSLPNLFHREEDKELPGLMEKWKDLEFLTMGRKPSSFARIVEQISLNCKNFLGLHVSGCINSEDTSALVKYLPRLKYLEMAGSSVSKRELLAILDGCKRLEVLDTSNCMGFEVDEEILERASGVKSFKCAGAKLFEDYMDCYDDVYWGMVF